MKALVSIVTSILIVAFGYGLASFTRLKDKPRWSSEATYALWIESVEVSSNSPTGGTWKRDGTAPNLKAHLFWRETIVLTTPEAPHTLIARWDRTVLKIRDLLKTEVAPNVMENVARVHANPEEVLTVEVRDQGLLSSSWIGGLSVTCGKLKPGLNVVSPLDSNSMVKSVSIRVVESSVLDNNGQVPEEKNIVTEGVVVVDSPVSRRTEWFKDHSVGKTIQEGLKKASKSVSGLLHNSESEQ
jgi:hypothetical protein